MSNRHFPKLFEPGRIANVKLKNRIVMLPMGTAFAGVNGEVTQRTIDHYAARAAGGVGLVIVGNCSPFGRIAVGGVQIDADWYMGGHFELAETVHACGAKICLQLNHPGSSIFPSCLEGRQSVSSSPVQPIFVGQQPYPTPRALEKEEIYEIIEKWAAGAVRAKSVGYDMIELHGGHGYLIPQFMSPFLNKRTDEFGGSFENRMRFPLEVIKRVRAAVGKGYPMGIRFSAEEFLPGGITLKESPTIARLFEEAGVDYLSVSTGTHETLHRSNDLMRDKEGWKLYIWDAIKKSVKIPTIPGGGLRTPAFCNYVLEQGSADFAGLARGLLADPEWANKAREGRVEDIRYCTSCLECLRGSRRRRQGGPARRCSVNAASGREREFSQVLPASTKRKVMIIGAGPGGMEAARIAAMRGHEVTIYDKGSKLGGGLLLASLPPGKDKWLLFSNYLATQLKKLKVKVKLNTTVSPALVKRLKPDGVIVSTGAEPLFPNIKGIKNKNVVHAWDVLQDKVAVKDRKVAVLGGGMVGCEVAEFLAKRGNQVSIVECLATLASEMEPLNRSGLLEQLKELKLPVFTGKEVVSISNGSVLVRDVKTGSEEELAADTFVVAMGAKSVRDLADALDGKVANLHVIGDAVEPRLIIEAVYEGSLAGRQV